MRTKSYWIKGTFLGGGLVVVLVFLLAFFSTDEAKGSEGSELTFLVKAGNLIIDVLESGSVEASNSQIIKSEVEGRTTIISIVPEGTILTEEDVKEEKILVELDSADLRDKEAQQEVTVQSAVADLTDASASYEIQKKQNESNLKQGELKVKFALMDLEKYLGDDATKVFLQTRIDPSELVNSDRLEGEALQKRRNLESNIDLAQEEIVRASEEYSWTVRLHEKGYVTRNEVQVDELALKRKRIQLEEDITSLALFKKYEFPKQAEKYCSDYEEAKRELDRIISKNNSEISKAEVRLNTNQAKYSRQSDQLRKIREQIEKCTIRATQPGLVVYAGSDRPWRDNQIEEGVQIYERQEILKIPNTTSMVVKAKVHESVIARVKEGQKAFVTIDAIPDQQFKGEVTKVGILPDSSNRWMNPNRKVYVTDVTIEGSNPNLKPGMSAQVRIVIDELKDVVQIPIQAVTVYGNQSVCYVQGSANSERRIVEVGDYNDKFIEIKSGLNEGEKVVLNTSGLAEKYQPSLQQQKDAIVPGPKLDKATGEESGEQSEEKSEEQLKEPPQKRPEKPSEEQPRKRPPRGPQEGKPEQGRPVAGQDARPS